MDIRGLQFEEKDGRNLADLQFLLVVAHRESGEFFRYDQGVAMKLQPATRERYNRFWFPITRDFELQERRLPGQDRGARHAQQAGRHRDPRVRGAAARHAAHLDPGAERHAAGRRTPWWRRACPAGRLVALARREFATGADLLCQFEVYGAKLDEKTGHAARAAGLRGAPRRRQRAHGHASRR